MTVFSLRARRAALWLVLALLLTRCALLSGGIGSPSTTPGPTGLTRILVTSSPALLPLISATAVLFERQHPHVHIDIRSSELRDGLNEVGSRQADMATTIRYADPSISSSMNLLDLLLCVVPFTIIAQSGIALPSLSYEQILGIFSAGTITNWKQVGGPDQKIVVVVPPMSSDIQFLFREEMLGGASQVTSALEADSLEALPQIVTSTPGSVSYLPEPFLTANVHVIAIDGAQPTAETIATNHYPFWSFAHLFTQDGMVSSGVGETDGSNNMDTMYLQFLQSTAGDYLARQLGYIPLPEVQIPPLLELPTAKISPSSVSAGKEGTSCLFSLACQSARVSL